MITLERDDGGLDLEMVRSVYIFKAEPGSLDAGCGKSGVKHCSKFLALSNRNKWDCYLLETERLQVEQIRRSWEHIRNLNLDVFSLRRKSAVKT